jgi:predicted DNA-binding transcriptional regulator YafY
VHHFEERYAPLPDMRIIRDGCWREEALVIRYTDKGGAASERTIWPLAIVYLDKMLVVLAWCCLRKAFRIFRAERIMMVEATKVSFRPRRVALLRTYLSQLTRP